MKLAQKKVATSVKEQRIASEWKREREREREREQGAKKVCIRTRQRGFCVAVSLPLEQLAWIENFLCTPILKESFAQLQTWAISKIELKWI